MTKLSQRQQRIVDGGLIWVADRKGYLATVQEQLKGKPVTDQAVALAYVLALTKHRRSPIRRRVVRASDEP
jgi:hypothetical protein